MPPTSPAPVGKRRPLTPSSRPSASQRATGSTAASRVKARSRSPSPTRRSPSPTLDAGRANTLSPVEFAAATAAAAAIAAAVKDSPQQSAHARVQPLGGAQDDHPFAAPPVFEDQVSEWEAQRRRGEDSGYRVAVLQSETRDLQQAVLLVTNTLTEVKATQQSIKEQLAAGLKQLKEELREEFGATFAKAEELDKLDRRLRRGVGGLNNLLNERVGVLEQDVAVLKVNNSNAAEWVRQMKATSTQVQAQLDDVLAQQQDEARRRSQEIEELSERLDANLLSTSEQMNRTADVRQATEQVKTSVGAAVRDLEGRLAEAEQLLLDTARESNAANCGVRKLAEGTKIDKLAGANAQLHLAQLDEDADSTRQTVSELQDRIHQLELDLQGNFNQMGEQRRGQDQVDRSIDELRSLLHRKSAEWSATFDKHRGEVGAIRMQRQDDLVLFEERLATQQQQQARLRESLHGAFEAAKAESREFATKLEALQETLASSKADGAALNHALATLEQDTKHRMDAMARVVDVFARQGHGVR